MGDTQVIAANGILRQEQRFNLIANNLSNIQTAGFKKDVPVFSKILSQSTDRFGGGGNQSSVTLFQQGDLQRTGNELNLAIEGEGFFKVQTPWGVRYTRNGNFALNQAGTLIDGNGFPVMGSRDEISLRGGKPFRSSRMEPSRRTGKRWIGFPWSRLRISGLFKKKGTPISGRPKGRKRSRLRAARSSRGRWSPRM